MGVLVKIATVLDSKAAMVGVAAVVAAVLLYVVGKKIAGAVPGAVGAVGSAINPTNPDNIFAGSVNAVGGAVSGAGQDWTLGGWLYDALHPTYDPNAPASPAPSPAADSWSLGSWLYDVTHAEYDPNAPKESSFNRYNETGSGGALDWFFSPGG